MTANAPPAVELRGLTKLAKLRAEGKTLQLATHKLKDVTSFTDRVTVFRAGKVTGEVETSRTNLQVSLLTIRTFGTCW